MAHWGAYRAEGEGAALRLRPFEGDHDPSAIGEGMVEALTHPARITAPMVRRSVLAHGERAGGAGRGAEPFVAVGWEEALALVAGGIGRLRAAHGNAAIYGGSPGWSSAGRFHHAQSQVHRFLNGAGGYTGAISNYSFGAADAVLPHVIGDRHGLTDGFTTWAEIAAHGRLVVAFGGVSGKNAQIQAGGVARHGLRAQVARCRAAGVAFVSVSPAADDTLAEAGAAWVPLRPTTDVALMLGIAHTLLAEDLWDRDFVARCCTGFERFAAYLRGETDGVVKDAAFAAAISGVAAAAIVALARRMAAGRCFIAVAWAVQRAEHGEQPCWMAVTLAAMLGQIGLPGGGFGFGYGSVNGIGTVPRALRWPALPPGRNPVAAAIPVARLTDMLERPGGRYAFNGATYVFPDVRMIYWAGGNPFHHHHDLNRLLRAWRRPELVVVHESWWTATARHADIVLPCATALERNDIAGSTAEPMLAACHKVAEPPPGVWTDYAIFSALAGRLGFGDAFTEGRDEEAWLRHLYAGAVAASGGALPDFETFWRAGVASLPAPPPVTPFAAFRADPAAAPLGTPSGRIEIFSEHVAGFGYAECPGHPAWITPREWLGSPLAARFPLHLLSPQPAARLHSQLDFAAPSQVSRREGREILRMAPADAARRGLAGGEVVRVFNERGACLAVVEVAPALGEGVVQMATGAWYDPLVPGEPSLEIHGNPNVLTSARGTSRLGQASAANSCMVEIERFRGALPPLACHAPPPVVGRW